MSSTTTMTTIQIGSWSLIERRKDKEVLIRQIIGTVGHLSNTVTSGELEIYMTLHPSKTVSMPTKSQRTTSPLRNNSRNRSRSNNRSRSRSSSNSHNLNHNSHRHNLNSSLRRSSRLSSRLSSRSSLLSLLSDLSQLSYPSYLNRLSDISSNSSRDNSLERDEQNIDPNNNDLNLRNHNLTEEEEARLPHRLIPEEPSYRATTPRNFNPEDPVYCPMPIEQQQVPQVESRNRQETHRSCLGCVLPCKTEELEFCLGCKLSCPSHLYSYVRRSQPLSAPLNPWSYRVGSVVPAQDPFQLSAGRTFTSFQQVRAHLRKQPHPRKISILRPGFELPSTRTSTPVSQEPLEYQSQGPSQLNPIPEEQPLDLTVKPAQPLDLSVRPKHNRHQ